MEAATSHTSLRTLSSSGAGPTVREMRQAIMMMERVPTITNKGVSLGLPEVLPTGRSTFGAAPRFGKPLYEGRELRKEQARMNCGTFGQGMYTVDRTRKGKPLNLGEKAKPMETGFGTSKRFKEPSRLDDQGPAHYDAQVARDGSSLRLRPERTPSFAKSIRGLSLYEGKEKQLDRGIRGLFGPGCYDVRVSRTGSPLKLRPQSTPSFGRGARFPQRAEEIGTPTVLDPEKARAFGKQAFSRRRSECGVGFGQSTRESCSKLHVPKAFYSTPPNVVRWVPPI